MMIPTEADWPPADPLDLDGKYARAHFFGKSHEEAVQLFEENAIYYEEDLYYMPAKAFSFYLKAFIDYLMSSAARDDADAASCFFISLISFMAEHDAAKVQPLWDEVEPTVKHVVEHQHDFYGADWFPYRDFRCRARVIAERGFPVSFDVSRPEIVPNDVTLDRLCALGSGPYPWLVAVQIFVHLGLTQLDAESKKSDVLAYFGEPVASGGGIDPQFGHHIPDWIHIRFRNCLVRFQFDDDRIENVHFMRSAEFLQRFDIWLPDELQRWL